MIQPKTLTRGFDAAIEVSDGERSVVAKINTDCVDRYQSVIDPAGIDLSAYRKNPVVLWNHGQSNDGLPVARCAWIKYMKAERCVIAKSIFLDDEFSSKVFKLYQDKVCRAWSVNIVPEYGAASSPTPDEIRNRPELASCYVIYRKCDLGEFSAVGVPGNSEALTLAVARGWGNPETIRAALTATTTPTLESKPVVTPEPELPKLTGARTFAMASEAIHRSITGQTIQAAKDKIDLMQGRI